LVSQPPDRRPRFKLRWVALAVAALVAAGVFMGVRARPNPRDNSGGHRSVEGVVLAGFGTSTPVKLAAYQGRPLVVNYWASWCTFCIAEMPSFQKAYERVGAEVAFVGVDVLDQLDAAKHLRNQTGVKYLLATDRDASAFRQLGGNLGMPTTFFVDRDGFVVERYVGPLTGAELSRRLREHFGV
jgi:thiol-disulfide isomerase/thioredoxin